MQVLWPETQIFQGGMPSVSVEKGHFARLCRAPKINHTEAVGSDDKEVLFVNAVKDPNNQSALVTCTVNEKHKVVFEIDTGASCNILPL